MRRRIAFCLLVVVLIFCPSSSMHSFRKPYRTLLLIQSKTTRKNFHRSPGILSTASYDMEPNQSLSVSSFLPLLDSETGSDINLPLSLDSSANSEIQSNTNYNTKMATVVSQGAGTGTGTGTGIRVVSIVGSSKSNLISNQENPPIYEKITTKTLNFRNMIQKTSKEFNDINSTSLFPTNIIESVCVNITVHNDLTYCILLSENSDICGVNNLETDVCPKKGDKAVSICKNSTSTSCVAPEDAICKQLNSSSDWQCIFPSKDGINNPNSVSNSSSSKLSLAAIIGISITCVAVTALLIALICFCVRRRIEIARDLEFLEYHDTIRKGLSTIPELTSPSHTVQKI